MAAIRQSTNRGLALLPNKNKRVFEILDSDDDDEDYKLTIDKRVRLDDEDVTKPRYSMRQRKGAVVEEDESASESESEKDSVDVDEDSIEDYDDDDEGHQPGKKDNDAEDDWIVGDEGDEDDEDGDSGETIRDQINEAIYGKNNSTMDETLSFGAFDDFVWDSTFHSILQSPFYCKKLRDKIITAINSRGNGGFAGVMDFHRKFLEILEAGQNHRDRVQIERVYVSSVREGKCDCCIQKRQITSRWRISINDEPPFYWSFGEVCQNALIKIVAIYNAFLWLSRPHCGESNHGFVIGSNELGITQFGWKTPIEMRKKAHEAFREIVRDMSAPTGIHLSH